MRNAWILPIRPAISEGAADLIDLPALPHGVRLAHALIGATAIEQQATLITAMVKHFSAVDGLNFEAFEP